MTPDQWCAFEELVWGRAVEMLQEPLLQLLTQAVMDAPTIECQPATKCDMAAFYKQLSGDPDNTDPIRLDVTREGRHYRLTFTAEELDAVDYGDTSNITITDEDPTFRELARQAKEQLDRRRGYLVPQTYPMTREMYDTIAEEDPS